jgi:hypothetical protein
MLDVHPPHAPTHTWRDFLIHIATICVGLLIAVALEQAVEAMHRDHERRELIQNFQHECRKKPGPSVPLPRCRPFTIHARST